MSEVARRCGGFTLSLDFELIWGTLDRHGVTGFGGACEVERAVIIDRLLGLLEEFGISATWCVLGHLFLDQCRASNGVKHAEIVPPKHGWVKGDWFALDPATDETAAPIFYGRSLVRKVLACPVSQEIGCHSFSHVTFGDPGCSRETATTEVRECVRLARALGLTMYSFVFPHNSVGHLDVLREYGFRCYRGPDPQILAYSGLPEFLRRIAHLRSILLREEPVPVLPQMTSSGLWNLAGSMSYLPAHGVRKYIPVSFRVTRARRGLDAAVRQKKIFHLWFHPTDLAHSPDPMLDGLREIFRHAADLRNLGDLEILPMAATLPVEEAVSAGKVIPCR